MVAAQVTLVSTDTSPRIQVLSQFDEHGVSRGRSMPVRIAYLAIVQGVKTGIWEVTQVTSGGREPSR